jgi:hypothetical protein
VCGQPVAPDVIHQVLELRAVDVLVYVMCLFGLYVHHAVYVLGRTVVQGVLLYALPGYAVRDVGVQVFSECACGHLLEQGLALVFLCGLNPACCYRTVVGV